MVWTPYKYRGLLSVWFVGEAKIHPKRFQDSSSGEKTGSCKLELMILRMIGNALSYGPWANQRCVAVRSVGIHYNHLNHGPNGSLKKNSCGRSDRIILATSQGNGHVWSMIPAQHYIVVMNHESFALTSQAAFE
jgi:hypothetical protein